MIRIAALFLLFAPTNPYEELAESGRIVGFADLPSERLNPQHQIAPGAPPVLSFRKFDAGERGRFGDLGLMTDDAGH